MKNKRIIMASVALAMCTVAGCASTPWGNESASTSASAAEIASLKAELALKEEALAQQQLQLDAEKERRTSGSNELGLAATQTSGTGNSSGLLPPDPKPGECYARVIVFPQKATIIERKLIKDKADRIEVIPASYKKVNKQVMVKPETKKLVVVDAVYETVKEKVLVKPAVTKTKTFPAKYETVVETKLIPESTEWKLLSDLSARGSPALASPAQIPEQYGGYEILDTRVEDTGDLMCLVLIPEHEETFEWQKLVKPAYTTTEPISEDKYRMVDVEKLVKAETTREITIPAVYAEVAVEELRPHVENRIDIPAEYTEVTRQEIIGNLHDEWRSVLCEVNANHDNVTALQLALNEKGRCQSGTNSAECVDVDGILGQKTRNAARRYAEQNGLSASKNYVTIDVVHALGVEL